MSLRSFNPYRPTLSLARGTNRQCYCAGVIIYNKTRQLFFVSLVRQTFLGFEMTSDFRDVRHLNQLRKERLFQVGTAQPFFPPGSAGNFGFGTALIQTSNFS